MKTLIASLCVAALLLGCRPTPPMPTNPSPTTVAQVTDASPYGDAAASDDPRSWNLAARAGAVTETLHGVEVSDPYRALEEDSPTTRAWIEHQTNRSERYLAAHRREGMEQALTRLSEIGALAAPTFAGAKLFYRRREAGQEQPTLVWIDPTAPGYDRTAPGRSARVLIDPVTFGERAAMDWYVPSPRGRYVAFGISQNGDERSVLRIYDLRVGRALQVAIAHTKWCRLSWLPDETGFYYTRYPREGEREYDAERPDTYWRRLYHHRLGARPDGAEDPLVFSGTERTEAPSPTVSSDGRWLVINLFKGWSRHDVFLVDRRAPVAHGAQPHAIPVAVGHESLSEGTVYRGRLYLHTNRDAPNYRLLSASVAALVAADARTHHRAPGTDATSLTLAPAGPWRTVLAEAQHPLEETAFAGNYIVARYLENIVSTVKVFALDGAARGTVALPSEGNVSSLGTTDDQSQVALLFASFFVPPTVLSFDTASAPSNGTITPTRVDAPTVPVDLSRYTLSRGSARSADGTAINVFYMHRRDMQYDGTNPVLMNGYGGFNVALAPRFTNLALYWLERGGVYAVANLRGGSEFGEAWHRAGAREHKHRVFEDFEAALRWLAERRISTPERIAIHGGSNGGLLMGAMITRCPDAFRAAVANVGLYDMVRFHRFPPAEIWTTEYGSAEHPDEFRYLYEYSPYHRVRDGMRLPAIWIGTADHDTRVYWGHSTKFAARLQDAQAGQLPVYFYMERNVGHGAGMQRSDQVRAWVRLFSFVEDQLGVAP